MITTEVSVAVVTVWVPLLVRIAAAVGIPNMRELRRWKQMTDLRCRIRDYVAEHRSALFFGIAILITAILCFVPMMSVRCEDGESATFLIRLYNLMEFSPWGIVPLMAMVLIPMIIFSIRNNDTKAVMMILLFVGNLVSYVYSMQAAWSWLGSVGTSRISYHLGMFLYPIAFLLFFFEMGRFSKRGPGKKDIVSEPIS